MVIRYNRGDKMVRVTFEDGGVIDFKGDDVIAIENSPARDTPKPGWQRTREYPPECRRATLCISASWPLDTASTWPSASSGSRASNTFDMWSGNRRPRRASRVLA